MVELIFWILAGLIIYGYIGYPVLLTIASIFIYRPIKKSPLRPPVTVVMAVYNEEKYIAAKVKNLLDLDYPRDKLTILIGSDGSTDGTNDSVMHFMDERISSQAFAERRGKVAVLNDLMVKVKNDLVVFTDARQLFDDATIPALMANFADPSVGCVSGELILSKREEATAKGINVYWNYEKFIRARESRIHSMLGATGAIYALRCNLFQPLPANIILDDMYTPLMAVRQGFRAVFDGQARAYDEVAATPQEEHRRKVRTIAGNYQIFAHFMDLFNPFTSPVAIQFFSHKFLRVVMPFFLITLLGLNVILARNNFYEWLLLLQMAFYSLAVAGALSRKRKDGILWFISRFCYVPYVFCLLNFSALAGFYRFVLDRQKVTWEKGAG